MTLLMIGAKRGISVQVVALAIGERLSLHRLLADFCPWQTNNILIIIESPPKMHYSASICPDMPTSTIPPQTGNNVTEIPKRGKMRQVVAVNRSKNVVEIGGSYYSDILV